MRDGRSDIDPDVVLESMWVGDFHMRVHSCTSIIRSMRSAKAAGTHPSDSIFRDPPCGHLHPCTVCGRHPEPLWPRTPSLLATRNCSCKRTVGRGLRDGDWQFLHTRVSHEASQKILSCLTDVEEEDRHQHAEIDAGKQDENPESNSGDEIRCNLVHNSSSN